MEKRYKLFDATLAALHSSGALSELILIGSWCQHVYKYTTGNIDEIPALFTSDIDFLIPLPLHTKKDIDVPAVLEDLGFEMVISPLNELTKYIRRELEVEFLVAEWGRGSDSPYKIKALHLEAQRLRYLQMLQEHNELVMYRGIPIRVAILEAFVLHKFLISSRRDKAVKKEKDLASAVQLSELIMRHPERVDKSKSILASLHPRWKKDILYQIETILPGLYSLLGENK